MSPRAWCRCAWLLVSVLLKATSSQIQNADYSGKVNVRVNQVLTNRPRDNGKVAWPSIASQEFAGVNVNILGHQIDSATFHKLRPNDAQRNARKLRRILGSHFEKEFMSVEEPTSQSDSKNLPPQVQDPALVTMVSRFKFNFTDQAGVSLRVDKQHEYMFRKWLVQQASCPVDYFWEDLGELFWPRWVRRGRCLPTHRCSWPPGMQCRASHSRVLKLLQWKCSHSSVLRKNKRNLQSDDAMAGSPLGPRMRRRKKRKRRRGKRGRGRFWETRERRKYQRIRRRLIRKLSMSLSGYYCHWKLQSYVVHDRCSCSCH